MECRFLTKRHFLKENLMKCLTTFKEFILLFLFLTTSCHSQEVELLYPVAPKNDIEDSYFSETILDTYRILENEEMPTVRSWYKNQNELAVNILNKISGRQEMLESFLDYDDRVTDVIINNKIISNGYHFYLKRSKGENLAKLYFKKNYDSPEILLYNPMEYNKAIDNNSISYYEPSWDGKKVVIAITNSGKEISDLITLTVSDRSIASEVISGARPDSFLGVSWLPDNSGFTFLQFAQTESEPNYCVLHILGQPSSRLKKVFGTSLHSNVVMDTLGVYPIAKIFNKEDPYVIGYAATVESFWDAYIADMEQFIKGTPNWKLLYTKDEKVYTDSGRFSGNDYIIKSNKDSESNALYRVDIENQAFAKAELLCSPPNGEILKDLLIKGETIFYTAMRNGVSTSFYKCRNGLSTRIDLPSNSGSIYLRDNPSDINSIYVSLSGWTLKNQRYLFNTDSDKFLLKPLSTEASYPDFNDIVSKEIDVASHDGTIVPLSIIYGKNIKMDSSHPTLFYGYGSYGTSLEPFFSTPFLHWVKKGGVLCIPHVRGGGEKGEQWHRDGMMTKKENTWKDLIACTEYMINEGYTSDKKTAIYSSSAGGIMIGKALTERPSLFAAAIAEVPIMNPLRSEARKSGGGSNMLEYGTVNDSVQVRGLIKMDPYLSLRENTNYPAILLTAGENDPRVPKWMPGKFTARIQEFSSSKRPILFRIDKNSGHGTVDEKLKYYQEYVDVFSFAFWQTEHPEFTLEND